VGNVYQRICDPENIRRALLNAARGAKRTEDVSARMDDPDGTIAGIREMLLDRAYRPAPYRMRVITEPKRREIHILPFYPDRIVQHAVVDVLGPLVWEPRFISDSYACRVGKGTHRAVHRASVFVRNSSHYLKCDIRGFYHSIDHNVLKEAIQRGLKDADALRILFDWIDSFETDTGVGCPIGNLTSQWFGNIYMDLLDHHVKERMRVKKYVRYCDDFIAFGCRDEMRAVSDGIADFVEGEMRLSFSKREIARTRDGLDFCGYRSFPRKLLLRRSTARRIARRMRGIRRVVERSDADGIQLGPNRILSMMGSASSAVGVCRWAQTYNFRKSEGIDDLYGELRRRHKEILGVGHPGHHGGGEGEDAGDPEQAHRHHEDGGQDIEPRQCRRREGSVQDDPVLLRG